MSHNYSQHFNGAWAIDRAREELQKMGWSVSPPENISKNGADLRVAPGWYDREGAFTVEVKLAHWNSGKLAAGWRVNRVTRKKDDFIAVVFPSGRVHFQDMKSWLRGCNKSGDRYVTKLGRLLG